LGIEKLDHSILIVKKCPTNVCVECVESKLENMQDFFSSKVALIEENKKLIEEKGLFEEDYDDI
jgi:hypothetical protein